RYEIIYFTSVTRQLNLRFTQKFQHIFTVQVRVLYIANFIAIAVTTIWNFWVNLKLSWRVTDVK
ncbi:MAG: hypothetical protein AAFX80_09555, partial [Cyanobacteria bacterium J06639_18]